MIDFIPTSAHPSLILAIGKKYFYVICFGLSLGNDNSNVQQQFFLQQLRNAKK